MMLELGSMIPIFMSNTSVLWLQFGGICGMNEGEQKDIYLFFKWLMVYRIQFNFENAIFTIFFVTIVISLSF